MNPTQSITQRAPFNRRHFCSVGGVAAVAALAAPHAESETPAPTLRTGNGEWTYDVVPGWGQLPAGKSYGGTHGAIATDKAGNVYVSTQSETGILVYSPTGKFLKTIAKASLIVLDDWGLTALSTQDRADLLEILDDRVNVGSTLIASQLPVDTWHTYLGEPTLADAILDRLVHQSHRIELKIPGESMRKSRSSVEA